jgi:hypothetical protein
MDGTAIMGITGYMIITIYGLGIIYAIWNYIDSN